MHCRLLLNKYSLPSAYDILHDPPSQFSWRSTVTRAVSAFWNDKLRHEASEKPSLRFLNTSSFSIGKTHPVWDTLSSNPREVTKATVKARILTGTYVLQANRAC